MLIVIGSLDSGGTERHLLELLPELLAYGYLPAVFTLTRRGTLSREMETRGVEVLSGSAVLSSSPNKFVRFINLSFSALKLWWTIIVWKPRILHFYLPQAYILGALISLLAPASIRIMSRRSLNLYQNSFSRWLECQLHSKMNHITGNSLAVMEELYREGVEPSDASLIYNGVKVSESLSIADKKEIRKEFGIHEDALVMIIVANLIPYKGHTDLFKALGLIRDALPENWILMVVGRDQASKFDLIALSEKLGIGENIIFCGERNDACRLMKVADLGILSSHEEGFSNTILEYMAAELPVIATAVGGNAEAVLDGETGLVVPSRCPKSLGIAIKRLGLDEKLRREFGVAGRDRLYSNFLFDRCVRGYREMYNLLRSSH